MLTLVPAGLCAWVEGLTTKCKIHHIYLKRCDGLRGQTASKTSDSETVLRELCNSVRPLSAYKNTRNFGFIN